jgi:hypothetical protein
MVSSNLNESPQLLNRIVDDALIQGTEPDWHQEFLNFTDQHPLNDAEWAALVLTANNMINQRGN